MKVIPIVLPFVFMVSGLAQEKAGDVHPHDLAKAVAALCDDAERAGMMKPYDDPSRTDWHYIPKTTRKGLDLRKVDAKHRTAAFALLASSMSEPGFRRARAIMEMEGLLAELEKKPEFRDPKKYYLTIFGEPGTKGAWGYSFEGHHLSLNFSYEDGALVCATPMFLAANPDRVVKTAEGFPPVGTRLLDAEQDLALELLKSLDANSAITAPKPQRDMKEGGKAQAHERRRIGVAAKTMTPGQRKHLDVLVDRYLSYLPKAHAAEIRKQMLTEELTFAWNGRASAKSPHSYQVVGPTHAIVYYNTQGDSVGTKVNHSHAILRTIGGDFNLQE